MYEIIYVSMDIQNKEVLSNILVYSDELHIWFVYTLHVNNIFRNSCLKYATQIIVVIELNKLKCVHTPNLLAAAYIKALINNKILLFCILCYRCLVESV